MKQAQGEAGHSRAAGKRKTMAMAAGSGSRQIQAEDEPSFEVRVQAVAYAIYEKRGCVDGHDLDDWLAAEAAVAREAQKTRSDGTGADH